MKRWVCILLLITLSSMHGIFEAAGSLSKSNMTAPEIVSLSAGVPADSAQCCDNQKIDIADLVFHCPLDGKILSTELDFNAPQCAQLHEASEPYSMADAFDEFFLRPPIA